MDSDADDTRSHTTQNQDVPTPQKHKKHKKHKKKKQKVPTVAATIHVIPETQEKTPPLVAYFPSGFDPIKEPYSNSTRVGFFRHTATGRTRRHELVVTPNGSNIDFVGTSYTGEAATGQTCNYALGVLEKDTQTLKIVPIVANKIFRLEPNLRGANLPAASESAVTEQLTEQEMEQKNVELHRETLFGTKKAMRASKKMRSLMQEEDPDAQKVMEDKLKQVVPNKEALEGTQGQVSVHVPPFNQSATTPQEAYPLDKIISTGEWDSLQDIYDLLQSGENFPGDKYPKFVSQRIHKLQGIEEEEKFKLSCIFSYITHLIKFKDQHTMDGVSSTKGHKIPDIIYHKLSSMFSSESRRLSNEKTNLLISYVLVLTLFADEFQTDLTDIAKDLRMSSILLRTHYEKLGCKLSRKNNVLLATLPVPLKFPELRQRRQKRQR